MWKLNSRDITAHFAHIPWYDNVSLNFDKFSCTVQVWNFGAKLESLDPFSTNGCGVDIYNLLSYF